MSVTTAALALVLVVVGLAVRRLVSDLRVLPRPAEPAGEGVRSATSVSVVIPARDEAGTVPILLTSLLGLTTTPHEIIVVDDGSTDATAALARSAGADVVSVTGPPSGWTGKAWACQSGADASTGDLLLFLDADTRLAPDALDGLVLAQGRRGGLVSVQPFHEVRRPYEQLSAYFNVVSLLASAAFGAHPDRRPMAFGPCLITSRADYDRAGGHAAARADVLDDVQLAAAYHRAGLPVRCYVGAGSLQMRMYPAGLRQLAEGWTKNIASGAAAAAPGPAVAVSAWVAAHHAVAVGAALALLAALTGHASGLATGSPELWGIAWVGVAWQLRSMLRPIGSFRWWTWAIFPVALLGFDVLFLRSLSLSLGRRSVRWRGRDVQLPARGPAPRNP